MRFALMCSSVVTILVLFYESIKMDNIFYLFYNYYEALESLALAQKQIPA